MPKHARTIAPIRTERLDGVNQHCSACGHTLWQQKTRTRTVVMLEGVVQLHVTLRTCQHAPCPQFRQTVHPEAEGRMVLPRHEIGLDVVAQIGNWRYRDSRSVPEMHALLRERGLPISERSVTTLLRRYDELLTLHMTDPARIRAATQAHGRVILALDGLQPQVGHDVLWVLRDTLSNTILLARSLLSATTADLTALIREVTDMLDVPISSVISDGQRSIRCAVAAALPGVPHQLCQFHYLREAGKHLTDADRHAKKLLKKALRGIRPLERQMAPRTDPLAAVVQAYCVAIRSALTDGGTPPLDGGGLQLYERIRVLAASLERLAEKGGSRTH